MLITITENAAMVYTTWRDERLERALAITRPTRVPLLLDVVAADNIRAAIAPDGSRIVFGMRGPDGKERLATRLLDQANATLLGRSTYRHVASFVPDRARSR
jgi:hypothetical protein